MVSPTIQGPHSGSMSVFMKTGKGLEPSPTYGRVGGQKAGSLEASMT